MSAVFVLAATAVVRLSGSFGRKQVNTIESGG